jgi:Family of unknown function (DUF6527)
LKAGSKISFLEFCPWAEISSWFCSSRRSTQLVTPLGPTDWKLIFDGKTISLDPSIGNWSFTCQSHYWIRNNTALWAARWSKGKIDAARAHDCQAKDKYFAAVDGGDDLPPPQKLRTAESAQPEKGFWRKLKKEVLAKLIAASGDSALQSAGSPFAWSPGRHDLHGVTTRKCQNCPVRENPNGQFKVFSVNLRRLSAWKTPRRASGRGSKVKSVRFIV